MSEGKRGPKGLYRHGKSGVFHYDFQIKGRRFHGSTDSRSEREAVRILRAKREEARLEVSRLEQVGAGKDAPMTIAAACGRYHTEIGQYHTEAKTTWRNLRRLVEHFGPGKRLMDVTDSELAELVALRRGEGLAPASVNRHTTEVLRKVMLRAENEWGQSLPKKVKWRKHILPEPRERIREASEDEEREIFEAIRPDYHPLVEFAFAAGVRLREAVELRWPMVDWGAGVIRLVVKGKKVHTIPISTTIRLILWPLQGHHETAPFTYVCIRGRRGSDPRTKGLRYPITREGLKTMWRRSKAKHSVEDFRFHDIRHTTATRLLRETGNLKLVQRLLGHESITTTMKYAHATTDDLRAGMDRVGKSRTKSRTGQKAAGE